MGDEMRKYYEAYDKRYQRIHENGLMWFKNEPTPELLEWLEYYKVPKQSEILEVGCGEGRDAIHLAGIGYKIIATDISEEAIKMCKKMCYDNHIQMEILREDFVRTEKKVSQMFNWIYSIGTLHMLVVEEDRRNFLMNLFHSLNAEGRLMLVSKGDGKTNFKTDLNEAFDLVEREHYLENQKIKLEATSFCKKEWKEHIKELEAIGFIVDKTFNSQNEIYDECMVVYLRKS